VSTLQTVASRKISPLTIALAALVGWFYLGAFIRGSTGFALVVAVLIGIALIAGLLVVGGSASISRIEWIDPALAVAGAVLTACAYDYLGLSTVLAVACVGTLAAVLVSLHPALEVRHAISIYAGAFVGMTSGMASNSLLWIVIGGFFAGVAWSVMRNVWVGVGGKMGSCAYAGIAVVTAVAALLGHTGMGSTLPTATNNDRLLVISVACAAAFLTHWLAYSRGWGIVWASALTTLVVALPCEVFASSTSHLFAGAWLGGTFVGMTAPWRRSSWWPLAAMAVLFGLLMTTCEPYFLGLGGQLGLTASVSVIAVLGAQALVNRLVVRSA
jgi:hypothetical protein